MPLAYLPDRTAFCLWGRPIDGRALPLLETASALAAIPTAAIATVSGSVATWILASKLGIELVARERVVPTIARRGGRLEARWGGGELLAGQMPQTIDEAVRAAGTRLFPAERADLTTDCSCPDWGDPCKHVAATHYVLGEALDRDPFLLFELRGRTREQVLDALRAARTGAAAGTENAGPAEIATVTLGAITAADYDRPRAALPALHLSFDAPVTHGAVLRQLGTPATWSGGGSPADALAPLVRAAAERARKIALAEPAEAEEPRTVATQPEELAMAAKKTPAKKPPAKKPPAKKPPAKAAVKKPPAKAAVKKPAKKPGNPRPDAGTREQPWTLTTPPGSSTFLAFRDEALDPPALVVQVGKTELRYHLRCLTDLHAMLKQHGDWMALGSADEQKPATDGTVEAWGRAASNPVGGWYGLKNGLRGRFGMYVPPVLEALGLAEVEHLPRNNRMRST